MTVAAAAAVPRGLRGGLGLLLLPVVAFYLVMFVWPSLNVLWLSITHDQHLSLSSYIAFFSDPFSRTVLLRTVRLALLITVAALVISYPIALYLADPERRGRGIVTFVVLAPLLVSAVVRAYGWIIILGPNGLLSDLLLELHLTSRPTYLLFSESAIVIAVTHVYLPFMVLAIAGSLQQIDPALGRAARNLGASSWRAFFRVTLPLSLPGITAGSLIVFCLSASAFVTPTLLGGSRVPMMAYLVYNQGILLLDWHMASTIALILLMVTAGVTLLYSWATGRGGRTEAAR